MGNSSQEQKENQGGKRATAGGARPILKRMSTVDSIPVKGPYLKAVQDKNHQQNKDQPQSAPILDATTDSIKNYRPSSLPPPSAYLDVTGFDHLQPAYMGMTVEQNRAFKRAIQEEEDDYEAAAALDED